MIKRDGREVNFDAERIRHAIESANEVMSENERLTAEDIDSLTERVAEKCAERGRALGVRNTDSGSRRARKELMLRCGSLSLKQTSRITQKS